jgi:hypothetical protein
VLICATAVLAGVTPPTVDEIVRKHESGLKAIYSCDLTISCRVSEDQQTTWKGAYIIHVQRSGLKERMHQIILAKLRDGKLLPAKQHNDVLTNEEGQWRMQGLDPSQPPTEPVTLLGDGTNRNKISGRIAPPQTFGPHGYKTAWLYPVLLTPTPVDSLRELCRATPGAKPYEGKDGNGDPTWKLDLAVPNRKGSCIVAISPKHNYMICESDLRIGKHQQKSTVTEFYDVENGASVPKLIKSEAKNPDQLTEVTVENAGVNVPIDDAVFTLRYPKGIAVGDDAKDCFYIWGDGKPELTLKTGADLMDWRKNKLMKERRAAQSGGYRTVYFSIAFFIAATVVLIGLIVVRKKWQPGTLAGAGA